MALDAGRVEVGLGADFDRRGFDQYDRAVEKARREKNVETALKGDYDKHAFTQYEKALKESRDQARRRSAFKAELKGDYDARAFRQYEKALTESRQDARRGIRARLFGDFDRRGFAAHDRAMVSSRREQGRLAGSSERTGRGFSLMGRGAGALTGLLVGGAGLGAALRYVTENTAEAQKVSAQTDAVLRSTGGAAKVSRDQIVSLAESLAEKTGIDDEQVQSSENLLLTFTKIRNEAGKGNDIFARATKTTLDLSVAFGKDLSASSILVGKALNDPKKGVMALQRVGVQFTKGQRDQIDALVDSGKTLEAQKLILAEVETQVRGSAEAYGKTTPGAVGRMQVALGNLSEDIGERHAPAVSDLADRTERFVGEMRSGEGQGGKYMRFLESMGRGVATVARWLFRATKAIVGFGAEHPRITKLAGAIVAVGVALQGLRLLGAITGVTRLVRAARGAPAAFNRMRDAGRRAGNAIGRAYQGLDRRLGRDVRRAGDTVEREMRSSGRTAGRQANSGILAGFRGLGSRLRGETRRAGNVVEREMRSSGRTAGRGASSATLRGFNISRGIGREASTAGRGMERTLSASGARAGRGAAASTGTQYGRSIGPALKRQEDRTRRGFSGIGRLAGGVMALAFLEQLGPAIANGIANLLDGVMKTVNDLVNRIPGVRDRGIDTRWATDHVRRLGAGLGRVGGGRSAFARRRRGGPIGVPSAFGGGDRRPILAEDGEHVWTKEEVRAVGGHPTMYAMRAAVGGGGQSPTERFQRGGAVRRPARRPQRRASLAGRSRRIDRYERQIEAANRDYEFRSRDFQIGEEELVIERDDGPPEINQEALGRKVRHLETMRALQERIRTLYLAMIRYVDQTMKVYRATRVRLARSIRSLRAQASRGGRGASVQARRAAGAAGRRLGTYREKYESLGAETTELLERRRGAAMEEGSTRLTIKELGVEMAGLDPGKLLAEAGGGRDKDEDRDEGREKDRGRKEERQPETRPPSLEEIATAGAEQLQAFSASRSELARSFGSNFSPRGQAFLGDSSSQAYGVRAFGAFGAGDAAGGGLAGADVAAGRAAPQKVVQQTINFPYGPNNQDEWTRHARQLAEQAYG